MAAVISVFGHAAHSIPDRKQVPILVIGHRDGIAQFIGVGEQVAQPVIDVGDRGIILLRNADEPSGSEGGE